MFHDYDRVERALNVLQEHGELGLEDYENGSIAVLKVSHLTYEVQFWVEDFAELVFKKQCSFQEAVREVKQWFKELDCLMSI